MNPEVHIDAPALPRLRSRYLRLRGWAHLPGHRLQHVRLVLGGMTLTGTYGMARPDVRLARPEATDHTGFELRGTLPPGPHQGSLDFLDQSGTWHVGKTVSLDVPRWDRPLWFPGSDAADLVAFQLGAQASHPPRALVPERFPAARSREGQRPALAIVTPSFNQGVFLDETIRSVIHQPGASVRYHVQDGGSTDGSAEVIRRHAGALASWESGPDDGQADAIAKGFARLTGQPDDLMAWLNADDVYLPGALAYVADLFARHPELDVVYGDRVLLDDQSREIGRWFLPPHDDGLLRLNDFVPQETLFWRRRLWDRVGGIDPRFQFAMDWDLLLRFRAAGARIRHVPYFLACFRIHAAQKTSGQMEQVGQHEIDALRTREQGRRIAPEELEQSPVMLRALRRSARRELCWRGLGLRVH